MFILTCLCQATRGSEPQEVRRVLEISLQPEISYASPMGERVCTGNEQASLEDPELLRKGQQEQRQ